MSGVYTGRPADQSARVPGLDPGPSLILCSADLAEGSVPLLQLDIPVVVPRQPKLLAASALLSACPPGRRTDRENKVGFRIVPAGFPHTWMSRYCPAVRHAHQPAVSLRVAMHPFRAAVHSGCPVDRRIVAQEHSRALPGAMSGRNQEEGAGSHSCRPAQASGQRA
jgi:hypothetical protein